MYECRFIEIVGQKTDILGSSDRGKEIIQGRDGESYLEPFQKHPYCKVLCNTQKTRTVSLYIVICSPSGFLGGIYWGRDRDRIQLYRLP